jgi:hypothetical protein
MQACYMKSLTRRGHALPDLDIYGDIEEVWMLRSSCTACAIKYDWCDGVEPDDEINLITAGVLWGSPADTAVFPPPTTTVLGSPYAALNLSIAAL